MTCKDENGWIVTYTGKKFWPLDPDPEAIDILDIAHALSNVCRFTGHTRDFYSVAQHSYLVALGSGCEHVLCGLLHDASEAYLCDISTPVKHSPMFEGYRRAEQWLQQAIFHKFGLPYTTMPQEVLDADRMVGAMEGVALMPERKGTFWTDSGEDGGLLLLLGNGCWSPKKAEKMFLLLYDKIKQKS